MTLVSQVFAVYCSTGHSVLAAINFANFVDFWNFVSLKIPSSHGCDPNNPDCPGHPTHFLPCKLCTFAINQQLYYSISYRLWKSRTFIAYILKINKTFKQLLYTLRPHMIIFPICFAVKTKSVLLHKHLYKLH